MKLGMNFGGRKKNPAISYLQVKQLLKPLMRMSSVKERRHVELHRLSGCFCSSKAPHLSDVTYPAPVQPGSDPHPG